MKVHKNEILIYYNPTSSSDKKTVAYAQSISKNVKSYSFQNAPNTSTLWQGMVELLSLHPKQMMNKAKPYYQTHIRGREFSKEGWLKILKLNPDLIKAPIAIKGNKAILCINATDIYKLQQ